LFSNSIRYLQFIDRFTLYYTRHKSAISCGQMAATAEKTRKTPARKAGDTGAKAPGRVRLMTLEDLDRTGAYKLTRAIIEQITEDLGGSDRISAGEGQLVQRAAVLGAMAADIEARWIAGSQIDPLCLATIANAQRRLLETIGLKRQANDVTPSLDSYMKAHQPHREAA
jgi:hypothetical protein